ncbi:T9SS type A sorting domain-containing protein [Aureisphaera sp. CAU 1614]|uniref:T9SS type A sorting domain-containing protein n=1 Tax=Halomarinibacterium sedimenti TaxID=2857106 RepID=A0A9X1FLI1_9FLAO|nr:T9SS type A sorting domain-containing protein [Halomarinibacterium sedimenti]MBW2936654.1 T9SS type A sorting domain-containing protein [Halomarinibacterium sedimenti]
MKKLLTLFCAFATITAVAQFNVESHAGDPILDGQMIIAGALNNPLPFYVNNESTTDEIYMKCEFVSAVNYDGVDMQLCFGLCYDPVAVGDIYPPGSEVVTIQPGQHQDSDGDKFLNYNDGGGNIIDYVFRFFQVDAGGVEIGDDLTFTYRYDPALGVNDNKEVKANITNTVVRDVLTIEAIEEASVVIYDIRGRAVSNQKLIIGTNTINVANLPSQVYLVQMTNDKGFSQAVKIVKN